MKQLNCIIIDDEEMAVKVIERHLSHIEGMEVAGVFYSGIEAFLAMDKFQVDVLFLDIQMPKLTGLSMLKMMKDPPLTVLTTAHRDYALAGFDMDVVDYLLKPISFERFLQTVKKIRRMVSAEPSVPGSGSKEETQDHIFIKSDRNFIRIRFQDLLFVEAIKNHVRITTTAGNHISLINLSSIESQLPTKDFLRVHRSYIINMAFISAFNNHSLSIGGQTIPIGRSYKEMVKARLKDKLSL